MSSVLVLFALVNAFFNEINDGVNKILRPVSFWSFLDGQTNLESEIFAKGIVSKGKGKQK